MDSDSRKILAESIVKQTGAPPTQTNIDQMAEYLAAFHIFIQRNEKYKDLWKDYGWMDSLTHVRSKAMRMIRKFWRDNPESDEINLDDSYDLVNYVVFFIRNFKEKNKWGRV